MIQDICNCPVCDDVAFLMKCCEIVIGATTVAEYRQYIEKDGALERRFQPIMVDEPSVAEAIEILTAAAPRYVELRVRSELLAVRFPNNILTTHRRYEEFHGVRYTPFAIDASVRLAERYIDDRSLPDKAIDLLDEAGSMVKLEDYGQEEDLPDDFFVVTDERVAEIVSELSGIPVGKLDRDEKAKLMRLEADITSRVKGQESAVKSVAKAIRRARSGLRDQTKPVATLMFCGRKSTVFGLHKSFPLYLKLLFSTTIKQLGSARLNSARPWLRPTSDAKRISSELICQSTWSAFL